MNINARNAGLRLGWARSQVTYAERREASTLDDGGHLIDRRPLEDNQSREVWRPLVDDLWMGSIAEDPFTLAYELVDDADERDHSDPMELCPFPWSPTPRPWRH